jgi:phenylacetate-CoA ligase
VGCEYQIHLRHRDDGRDTMQVIVERGTDASAEDDGALAEKIAADIRRKVLVRAQVAIVDPGSLPRTERKSQRVFDHRNGNTAEA